MATTPARKGALPTPVALAPAVAAATVFLASGAVLVLEILAVRLLAPYVGLTLETTTSIIGAALAGIAVGAALGGRLADRYDPLRLVVLLMVAGGLCALLTVPIVRWLGPGARGGGDMAALGITLLALVPGAAALSAVSPTVARLQLRDLHASGTIVGGLSAWATAGALVGTFGTGFVLVPLMPVSAAVLAIGIVLVLAGLLLGLYTRSLTAAAGAGAIAATVLLALLTATRDTPCDAESSYHCARVVADAEEPAGRELLLDGLTHSYNYVDDPARLHYGYVQWIADAIDAGTRRGEPLEIVFIGGGGFTLPRWLLATRPGSQARVLEVDGELVDLARERLGLRRGPGMEISVGDARMTMRDVPTASADVVVGDAFSNVAVPWHLTTREWLQEVRRVLRPGGLYALNVIDMRPLDFLHAQTATLLPLFDDVRMIAIPGDDGLPGGGNAVMLATDGTLPENAGVRNDTFGAGVYKRAEVERMSAGSEQLRDDFAPVDQLLTPPA